jgi:hypothetical protein
MSKKCTQGCILPLFITFNNKIKPNVMVENETRPAYIYDKNNLIFWDSSAVCV